MSGLVVNPSDPIGANDRGPNKSGLRNTLRAAMANKYQADQLLLQLGALNLQSAIIATSVSETTNFANVLPGDKIAGILNGAAPTLETVVTAGTKPSAAVVGGLYLVLRPIVITGLTPAP